MAQQVAIVDKLLSNVSSMYPVKGGIAEECLPVIQSKQDTGLLGEYGTDHLRIENTKIGGEGAYTRVRPIARATSSYHVEGHGLEGIVTESDYRNVEDPFDAEEDQMINLTSKLLLGKEYDLASVINDTAILTRNTTLSGTSQLNDYLNSDPLDVFLTARLSVKNYSGAIADACIMPWEVFQVIKYHPQFLSALGYAHNRPGGVNRKEMADILEVKNLYVPEISYNSANQGQTAVMAPVWGKNIVFAVLPTKAEKYQVSLGYLVNLLGRTKRRVYKTPTNNPPNGKSILVDDAYDMLISNVNAGYLIKNATA